MRDILIPTAYLAPLSVFALMAQTKGTIYIETQEHYVKQSFRNRCIIAGSNGPLSITVPIIKPQSPSVLIKDIRISNHGNWRHLHWNSLVSAYGMSPFFEYYEDDFAPFYEKKYEFLFDFNQALLELVCDEIDFHPNLAYTETYQAEVENDFRTLIHPRNKKNLPHFTPQPYYQVFSERLGFLPNLSIVDLLFNMGPESILKLL